MKTQLWVIVFVVIQRRVGWKKLPCAGYELNDRSKQEEGTVEGQSCCLPVWTQQPIKNFEPLKSEK